MARLFENLPVHELEALLAAGSPEAPFAHLTDPAALHRARKLARSNGILAAIDRDFDPAAPILAIKLSDYRSFRKTGSRAADKLFRKRRSDIAQAALALWLDHPKASIDHLQDLLWAVCDDFTWVMPAHEYSVVDLGASETGQALCEVMAVVGDRLEPEVIGRVRAQIEGRVLTRRNHPTSWWRRVDHNWNHVCNGNIVRIALHLWCDQPRRLAKLVHRSVLDMQLALDGFSDDGGCVEGPGYWTFGFGHYAAAAYALHAYTGGRINLMTADPKIERIARFPLAAHIEGHRQAPFADTSQAYVPAGIALVINRLLNIPELYTLCRANKDGSLALENWNELAMYRGQKMPKIPPSDSLLGELGLARIRSAPGKARLTVAATAGNNGVNHNHNDIGSFVACRDGNEILTDPGGPIYNSKTFTEHRYKILFCNSLGHSVPLINGRQQSQGKEFHGTLAVDGLDRRGDKSIRIEMARAYPRGTVDSLVRTLGVDYANHGLRITDAYRFTKKPREIIETFITYQSVRISSNGVVARIGRGATTATLAASQAGRFELVAEVEASKEGRTGQVLNRILFKPEKLAREMTLDFRLL